MTCGGDGTYLPTRRYGFPIYGGSPASVYWIEPSPIHIYIRGQYTGSTPLVRAEGKMPRRLNSPDQTPSLLDIARQR